MLLSCEELLIDDKTNNDPEINFEVFWKEFDLNYSYFEYKNINWDSIYNFYRPKVNKNTNDIELFNILSKMANELKDGHVNIYTPLGNSKYEFHNSKAPTNNVIEETKIVNYFEKLLSPNNIFTYGKVKNKNIGYIKIRTFGGQLPDFSYIDNIINIYQSTDGIIVDLRKNGGGDSKNAQEIVGRFADSKRLYAKFRFRNGPTHKDFAKWQDLYIEPKGKQYLKPTIVLTNEDCSSSTEDCILAFRTLPHVTIVGDTTGGASGNPAVRVLPNGWVYRLSNWQEVTPQMQQYEGIGLAPDSTVWISKEDQINGIDKILETAINIIERKK